MLSTERATHQAALKPKRPRARARPLRDIESKASTPSVQALYVSD